MKLDESKLVKVGAWITGIHGVATGASLVANDQLQVVMIGVFAGFFLAGVAGCGAAFLIAVNRSRHEYVHLAGAFFLADNVVSKKTRQLVYLMLAIQVVVGVGAASMEPFTPVAFSVLVPLIGMAIVALTGSICGTFESKAALD